MKNISLTLRVMAICLSVLAATCAVLAAWQDGYLSFRIQRQKAQELECDEFEDWD